MVRYYWAYIGDDHQPGERIKLHSTMSQDSYTTLIQVARQVPGVYQQFHEEAWWPAALCPYDLSGVGGAYPRPAEWMPLVDIQDRPVAILIRSYL